MLHLNIFNLALGLAAKIQEEYINTTRASKAMGYYVPYVPMIVGNKIGGIKLKGVFNIEQD